MAGTEPVEHSGDTEHSGSTERSGNAEQPGSTEPTSAEPTRTGQPAQSLTRSSGSGGHRISARAIVSLAVVALLVVCTDQFTKLLVVSSLTPGERNPVLGELLQFVFVKNSGAAFSLASGSTWIFSIAASAVTVFIILFAHRIRSLSWAVLFGMLLGGTLGNLIDRLSREPSFGLGHVVDFIQVWGFPAIFNVADIFIVSSMGLFIILSVRGVRLDGTRDAADDRGAVPEVK